MVDDSIMSVEVEVVLASSVNDSNFSLVDSKFNGMGSGEVTRVVKNELFGLDFSER